MGAVAAAAVMLVAIVAEDQTPLRAAPRADASVQAQLKQAQYYLDNTTMVAPEDGRVVNLEQEVFTARLREGFAFGG